MKLFLPNLGETKILIFFFPKSYLFLSRNASRKKSIFNFITWNWKTQLTSLAALHKNHVCWRWPMPRHIWRYPTVRKTIISKHEQSIFKEKVRRKFWNLKTYRNKRPNNFFLYRRHFYKRGTTLCGTLD